MSWDAVLLDADHNEVAAFNYTHNVNRMANDALDRAGFQRPHDDREVSRRDPETGEWKTEEYGPMVWWSILDGMAADTSRPFLAAIIGQLESDRGWYVAMNPENGWGDYDSFLSALGEMTDNAARPEAHVWAVSG